MITTDTGNGIKGEEQNKIFKMVLPEKADRPMLLTDGKQMGLGLFISKQITMMYSGDIDFVTSENGSTFICYLVFEPDEEQNQIDHETNKMSGSGSNCQSPRFGIRKRPSSVNEQNLVIDDIKGPSFGTH
jgi:hypothetical protein